jgi:xanthine dehydrogenase YagS FAD-binding subunit
VATPQIRNVGLAGNVRQRPWCWPPQRLPCLKNGGTTCFSITGENQFHAIFGGGPTSSTRRLGAGSWRCRIPHRRAVRGAVPAAEFVLPRESARENVLADGEIPRTFGCRG